MLEPREVSVTLRETSNHSKSEVLEAFDSGWAEDDLYSLESPLDSVKNRMEQLGITIESMARALAEPEYAIESILSGEIHPESYQLENLVNAVGLVLVAAPNPRNHHVDGAHWFIWNQCVYCRISRHDSQNGVCEESRMSPAVRESFSS